MGMLTKDVCGCATNATASEVLATQDVTAAAHLA